VTTVQTLNFNNIASKPGWVMKSTVGLQDYVQALTIEMIEFVNGRLLSSREAQKSQPSTLAPEGQTLLRDL
jgi:hypothetical protein